MPSRSSSIASRIIPRAYYSSLQDDVLSTLLLISSHTFAFFEQRFAAPISFISLELWFLGFLRQLVFKAFVEVDFFMVVSR